MNAGISGSVIRDIMVEAVERRFVAYAAGDHSGYKAARKEMGNLVMNLECDAQMESLLESRKRQLGIDMDFDSGMRLGRQLALSHGVGRGRGIGL